MKKDDGELALAVPRRPLTGSRVRRYYKKCSLSLIFYIHPQQRERHRKCSDAEVKAALCCKYVFINIRNTRRKYHGCRHWGARSSSFSPFESNWIEKYEYMSESARTFSYFTNISCQRSSESVGWLVIKMRIKSSTSTSDAGKAKNLSRFVCLWGNNHSFLNCEPKSEIPCFLLFYWICAQQCHLTMLWAL